MVSNAFKVEIVDGAVVTVLATLGYLASTTTTAPSTISISKASSGDHGRYTLGSNLATKLAGVKETDRIYTGLPLYHSSGQWFAMGASVHSGITVILRKGFSASNWWKDCVKYEATVAQYVGEIARFLLGK